MRRGNKITGVVFLPPEGLLRVEFFLEHSRRAMNMTGNPEELKVNRREIYRNLGIRSGEPDQATQALVESVLKELTDNV